MARDSRYLHAMPEQPTAAPPSFPSLGERLQNLTEALAAARTPQEVFGIVLRPALGALGAVAGAVLLVSGAGDRLEVAATQGHEAATPNFWQDGPLDPALPAGDALARHEALFFEHEGAMLAAYPALAVRAGTHTPVASAVLPMFLDGAPLGVLVLDFREPHDFTPEEGRFLRILAGQCAVALGRVRLLEALSAELRQRRETEAELRVSEARFRRLVEASPVGIAAGALDGRLILVNDAYLSLLGRTRAEYEAGEIDWAALTPPEYRAADERAFAQALGRGASDPYEKEMLTRAGERIPLNLILIRYQEGDQPYVVGYLQDLRPFKAAERVLREHGAELERQVAARTEELNARTKVLEAFEALTHELTLETDPAVLVKRAQDIVLSLLPPGVATYYEPEGEVWRLKAQTGDLRDGALQRVLDAGLPYAAAGNLRVPFETREAYYQEVYDVHTDSQPDVTAHIGSSATLPVVVGGAVRGVFGLGLFGAPRHWSAVDRALLETVARSLGLALEGAEAARRLKEQNAELAARTRALEGFADLTRGLSAQAEPHTLVRRAQEVVLSLLPGGYAAYYEPAGGQWHLRSQVGDRQDPAFQTHVEAGLPLETASLWIPWQTREAYYLEEYDQRTDHFEMYRARRGALAALPVVVNSEPYGIFGVALFHDRHWHEADKAVIETTVRSLGLALERAESVARLAQSTRTLERERTFLRAVLASLAEGIVACDAQGQLTLFSGATRRFHGLDAAPLPPEAWAEHYDLFEADGVTPLATERIPLYRAWRGEQVRDAEMVIRPKDGPARSIVANGQAMFTEDGEPLGAVVAMHDLTARKQAEQTLRQRTAELERSNAELEQFAYIASHDLQAPIRAVTSFAELTLRRYGEQLDERGRAYLHQIVEGGQHMKQLVDDLLTFSRVHTQQREPQPTDSNPVFDRVVRRLDGEIASLGARVTRADLPPVLADAQQLDQLFQNLLSNGLKYRREQVPPQVQVWAERDGPMQRFAVRDNGIGIEPQYFERIFVIFQRLYGREQFDGTGIGLAVCKKIVERHGGRLWLESTPGEGSTFFFTLPAV
ncbi:hypothetical protein GCM10025871_18000 [Deinococcus metallilatus]|nr:hypothetical protein GCM10025871_18000 [Deinococcus metallilatus]